VSRASDDALSAAAMVELGFLAMAQAWPLICRQRASNSEQNILAAGHHLDVQLQDLEKAVKKIMCLAGCATRMAREAESMKKLVTEMIRGIDVKEKKTTAQLLKKRKRRDASRTEPSRGGKRRSRGTYG